MAADRDTREGRATSFGAVAEAYERSRPGYPDEAVRWLAGDDPCDVVDLGAGTGKLTRSLVALGHRVTAVEPLDEMLAQLRAAVPGAAAVVGSAESIPLPDASADVVACAQAFHWFDHGPALDEIARVLRPEGSLALVWNTRDDSEPWVARLSETIGSESRVLWQLDRIVPENMLFGPLEHATFAFCQVLDRDGLRDLVVSRSVCAVRSPEERGPVLAAVDALFDEHSEGGSIELSYLTECFRAAKR